MHAPLGLQYSPVIIQHSVFHCNNLTLFSQFRETYPWMSLSASVPCASSVEGNAGQTLLCSQG
mgnify:CR=1 FL=1